MTLALIVLFRLRTFAFQTFYIPPGFMKPTLMIGDRAIVDKLGVDFGSINRGDIIVFRVLPAVKVQCNDSRGRSRQTRDWPAGRPRDLRRANTIYVNGVTLRENWPH